MTIDMKVTLRTIIFEVLFVRQCSLNRWILNVCVCVCVCVERSRKGGFGPPSALFAFSLFQVVFGGVVCEQRASPLPPLVGRRTGWWRRPWGGKSRESGGERDLARGGSLSNLARSPW